MGAGASSEQSSRSQSRRALSDSAAPPHRQLVLVNGLDAKSRARAESFRGPLNSAISQANTRSSKYPTLFVDGQRRVVLAGGELPSTTTNGNNGVTRAEAINWSSALQKINQRRRRAQEQGGEDDLRALTRNADTTTLNVLQRLQDIEAMSLTTTNEQLVREKLRALQECYPLLERTPPDRFAALASMVYYKEAEIYHSQGQLELAKTHYTRVIRLAEQRVARQEKDLYMVLKRYVLAMVGLARIWYLEERDTKGFTFADPRRQRLMHRGNNKASDGGSMNGGSHRAESVNSTSSLDSLESSLSSEDGSSVYSVNQAILRAMAPRPPRRRTGPHFTRVKLRAPHTIKAEMSREDAFVLNSKMTRELVASPCELLLLRCCEVVEIGHNCQSELLLPPLLELAQIYTDLDLLSRALLLVRRCVGILCAVYDYDHPWVIQLQQRAAMLNAALDAQRRNAMASKIQATWKMYQAMRRLEDALGRPVRRHVTLGAHDGLTKGNNGSDFLNAYLDQIPLHTTTPATSSESGRHTTPSTPRPTSRHGDPLAITRAGVDAGRRLGRRSPSNELPLPNTNNEDENALTVYDPVSQEGELTTYTTAVPNARVIGTTQDTETDTFVQPTAQGAMLTICTTTVARTVTEHMPSEDEEEEEGEEEDEEKEDVNEVTEEYEGDDDGSGNEEEEDEVLSIDRSATPLQENRTKISSSSKSSSDADEEPAEAAEREKRALPYNNINNRQTETRTQNGTRTAEDSNKDTRKEVATAPNNHYNNAEQAQPPQQQQNRTPEKSNKTDEDNGEEEANPFVSIADDTASQNDAEGTNIMDKEAQAQAVVMAVQRARLALQIYHSGRASEGSSVHLTSTNTTVNGSSNTNNLLHRPSSDEHSVRNEGDEVSSGKEHPEPNNAQEEQPALVHNAAQERNHTPFTPVAKDSTTRRRRKEETRVVISTPPSSSSQQQPQPLLPPLNKSSSSLINPSTSKGKTNTTFTTTTNAAAAMMSSSSLTAASQSTTEEGTVRTKAYVEVSKTQSQSSIQEELKVKAESVEKNKKKNDMEENSSSTLIKRATPMNGQVTRDAHRSVFPALPHAMSAAQRTSTRSTNTTTTTNTTVASSTDVKTVNAARRASHEQRLHGSLPSSTHDSSSLSTAEKGSVNEVHVIRKAARNAVTLSTSKVTRTLVKTTQERRGSSSNTGSSSIMTKTSTPLQTLPDVNNKNNNNENSASNINNNALARPLRSALTNGRGKTTPILTTRHGGALAATRKNSTSLRSQTESNVSAVSSNRAQRSVKISEPECVPVPPTEAMEDTLSDL